MQIENRQNNNYDFLRVFAALCITFTHSFNLLKLNNDEPLMKLTNQQVDFSFVGLTIFFAISGYLIAKSAATSPSIKNYMWKRFLRIQPLLIVVSLGSIFILGTLFTTLNTSIYLSKLHTYTYLRNIMPLFGIQFDLPQVFENNIAEPGINGSMWTLVVEERLYLFLGLLLLIKKNRKIIFFVIVIGLNILYLFHAVFFNHHLINYLNGGNVFYSLVFLNSSCIYLLNINFANRKFIYLLSSVLILFIAHFFTFFEWVQTFTLPFMVIILAHIKSIFTNNIGRYGDFTYGIYIFSFPIQQMLIHLKVVNDKPLLLFCYTLAIALPIAILSWHLLEKKMLLLKYRYV